MKSHPKLQESNLKIRVLFQSENFSLKVIDFTAACAVPVDYSAGDVEGYYEQIVIAAGQDAEAAMTFFEDLINPHWLCGKN